MFSHIDCDLILKNLQLALDSVPEKYRSNIVVDDEPAVLQSVMVTMAGLVRGISEETSRADRAEEKMRAGWIEVCQSGLARFKRERDEAVTYAEKFEKALRFYAAPANWGPVASYSSTSWYMNGRPWMTAYAALKDAGVDVSLTEDLPEDDEDAGEPIYTKDQAEALVAASIAEYAKGVVAASPQNEQEKTNG